MTEAEARDRLIAFADAGSEPVLTSPDLDLLIALSKRVDQFGVLPDDPSWEATFDVNYAIAQGWLLKASRLAPRYNYMSGGKMLSRQQYYDHAMKMYHKFAMKSPIRSVRLPTHGYLATDLPVPSNLD